MSQSEYCPRPLHVTDAAALIGILAWLTGTIWGDQIDAEQIEALRQRGVRDGYLSEDSGKYDVLQTLSDRVERLRFALGEYEHMPPSAPFPALDEEGSPTSSSAATEA